MRKKLKICRKTFQDIKLVTEQVSDDIYCSKLFLAGADTKGVIRSVIEVSTSDEAGCMLMTGAYPESLSEAYVELVKKDLVPIAFIHVYDPFNVYIENPQGYRDHVRTQRWGGDSGDDPVRYKHMFFIRTSPDFTQVVRYNAKKKKGKHALPLEDFDLQVVK